jgi:hypothetical protein
MKSLSHSIRTTAFLLAFAMPLTLDAETSASSTGGINLSTTGCGIDLDAPKHICRNVDDDQPGPHEDHEKWDIDHAPSEGENDLRMLTITGVAGLNGGNMTLEVPDEAELGLIRFWKDPGKEEPAYQFSWEVDPFSYRQEEIWVEGYDVGKVRFKAKMTCYPSEVKTTTATTKVHEIDLDIDSLNDNADPYSADGYTDGEDRIEASEKELDGVKKPGKIIISVPNEDHDADATPDFADLEIAGKKFVPVRVTLKTPFKTDKTKVSFDFLESKFVASPPVGPPAPLGKGGMRLWKKDAPLRQISDSIESKDARDKLIEHNWEDIIKNAAVVSQDKREVILYIEYVDKEVPEAAGRKSIAVTAKEGEEGEEGEESAGQCEDQIMVTLLPVGVNEVSFTGAKYHELKKDDVSVTYSAPHWVDKDGNGNPTDTGNGEKDYSVAYTRNTKPSIGAKFSIQGLPNNLAIKLRAKGSDGIEIPETAAQINGNEVTLPATASSTNWPNAIKFYDRSDSNRAFKLDWEIKAGDSNWLQFASTKHQVYLTLNDPVTALRQETLFFLSSKNANSLTFEPAVTTAIWNEFIDRSVSRVDGFELTYYQNYSCLNTETNELLEFGDGQCGAWAKFFIDLRRIQGISDQPWWSIRPVAPSDGLIVKNWDFTEPGTALEPGFPYFNMPGGLSYKGNTSYKWRFAEVNDHKGIPGQGNMANPASMFQLHSVVFLDGEYLDPSYGKKYLTLQDLDDAMAGFYRHPGNIYPGLAPVDEPAVNLDLNGNGTKTDLAVDSWVITFKRNPTGIDLIEKAEYYPLSNE